ncbi:MAG: hypothetical protein ACI8RZ_004696 [Myxococcota bacterium]|jgi:hypothetical protein
MNIPTHILMAMSAAALSAGCVSLTATTPLASSAPEIMVTTEVAPEEAPDMSVQPEETTPHGYDDCPPCGRG